MVWMLDIGAKMREWVQKKDMPRARCHFPGYQYKREVMVFSGKLNAKPRLNT